MITNSLPFGTLQTWKKLLFRDRNARWASTALCRADEIRSFQPINIMRNEIKKPTVVKASDTIIRNNLKRWFASASQKEIVEGLNWYNDATREADSIAREFGISRYKAAAVISALSPNNRWKRNVRDSWALVACWYAGKDQSNVRCSTYNANKAKAFRILDGELIAESAPKTHSFASTIAGIGKAVTVDKWHVRACLTRRGKSEHVVESVNVANYWRLERITAELAQEAGVEPYQYQAIVWVSIKNDWSFKQ